MAQSWHDLLFAHWALAADTLRRLIPAPLEIDTYHGGAWIGIAPFRMTGVRIRGVPALPGLSAFPELNVRTYVTLGGKPGVFFFSLDAGNRLAVAVARRWFHLPYFYARMSLRAVSDGIQYSSRRVLRGARGGGQARPGQHNVSAAEFIAEYHPTSEVFRAAPGTLEHWLTERYCLYAANSGQRIYRGEIHHRPWPLQPAEAEVNVNTMTAPLGIRLPDVPPLLHFARRLDVVVWPPERVKPPTH